MSDCEHGYETRGKCPFCRRIDNAKPATPLTPYGGTSGWSGSKTSKQRAKREDSEGVTSQRQQAVIGALKYAKATGLTWREVADYLEVHHGAASGVLSVLHKEGVIARLTATRDKCAIYVLPEYINDRATEAHGYKPKPCVNCGHVDGAA